MRRVVLIVACLLSAGAIVGSCADGDEPAPANPTTGGGAAGSPTTTGGGSPPGGSAGAGGSGELVPCLDRPDQLERPPTNELPCDLLPPGFTR
jgi:hypothetical protein